VLKGWAGDGSREEIYRAVNQAVQQVDPKESQLLYMPFLYRSHLARTMDACFIGLRTEHTTAHLLRAVFEGVAFAHRQHPDILAGGGFGRRRAALTGGAANSSVWAGIFRRRDRPHNGDDACRPGGSPRRRRVGFSRSSRIAEVCSRGSLARLRVHSFPCLSLQNHAIPVPAPFKESSVPHLGPPCSRAPVLAQRVMRMKIAISQLITAFEKVLLRSAMLEAAPFVRIEDWSRLEAPSRGARDHYLRFLEESKELIGLVLVRLPIFLQIPVRVARRIHVFRFPIAIVSDYETAVKESISLHARQNASQAPRPGEGGSLGSRFVADPRWRLQADGFTLMFEVIDGWILHGVSTGKLHGELVEPSFHLQEQVLKEAGLAGAP
jgi:hypothetical protein